jgi:KDO2-lipid IV(A) lauroyltransferase
MTAPAANRLPTLLRLRYALEGVALRSAAWAIPKLPLRFVRAAAASLGSLAWAVDWRGRQAGHMNLEAVYGHDLSPSARRRLLRRCYQRFATTFAEFFWSPRLSTERWDEWFEFAWDSPEAAHACLHGECVFATAHFGNFEWLSIGRALRSQPCMIIAQDFKNPPLTAIFRQLRSLNDRQTIIPREGAMLRMFKHLKKGGCAAALVDLNVPPDQSAVPIKVFDRFISVSVLHCALAARTGRPLVPSLAIPTPSGRWQLRFFQPFTVSPDDSHQEIAQRCWNIFEPIVRQHPECWMWMYKHWRYLPENAPHGLYPAYANRSRKFDRLLRAHQATPHP